MTERRSDVLIVGGGALGLGHAIAAVRAGLRVTLCERHDVARGASVRNFGMVWPIGQPPGVDLQTALRSRELWAQIADEAGFRCAAVGSLHLAHADDEWRVLEEFAATSPLLDLELLTPEEVVHRQPGIVPEGLRGALFSPHEANVDPGVAIAAMHTWLRKQGVDVRVGCPVVHIEPGVARLADGSVIHADRTVICAGDDFASLLPEAFADSGMRRCQLQMLSLGPQPEGFVLGPMLAAGLTLSHYEGFAACPSLPSLRERLAREFEPLLARGIHVMVSQGDDGRLIVGDSHDYQPPFAPGLDATTEHLILDYLKAFFQAPVTDVSRRWTGTYAKCANGASTFRAAPLPGIEVVTGVGGSGMTRSQALGEQTVQAW
tara:strand:- start:6 stop:1133 length:1128 start_codon:yes stop_codon:yes gene_type:complete